METNNVVFGETISQTLSATNGGDEGRSFDLSAEVRFRGDKMEHFNNGQVRRKGEENTIGSFSSNGMSGLSINLNECKSGEMALLAADVEGFVDALKAEKGGEA